MCNFTGSLLRSVKINLNLKILQMSFAYTRFFKADTVTEEHDIVDELEEESGSS